MCDSHTRARWRQRCAPLEVFGLPRRDERRVVGKTMSGSRTFSRASKSPRRDAARKASTMTRCPANSTLDFIDCPCTRRRARLAICRVALGERSNMAARSSNGTANMSCSTKASRSTGVSVSSTTNIARPTESASSASPSGPGVKSRCVSDTSSSRTSSRLRARR